jgi:hypothetical protein
MGEKLTTWAIFALLLLAVLSVGVAFWASGYTPGPRGDGTFTHHEKPDREVGP